MHVAENVAGSYTYEVECTGVTPAANAQVTIDFTSASGSGSGGSGSGGGGGGGGAIDDVSLIVLSLMLVRKTPRPRRSGGRVLQAARAERQGWDAGPLLS